jgi:hypothetical protein
MKATTPRLIIGKDLLLGAPNTLASMISGESAKRSHGVANLIPQGQQPSRGTEWLLSEERLAQSNDYLKRANKSVHRGWPTVDNNDAIRRDVYLVRWCETIYCAGLFTDDASLLKIAGDLAWPCQVYVDRFLYDQEPMDLCKLYMFDLKSECWFNWRYRWHRTNDVPSPSGIYTALGTDRLSKAGKQAVESIWINQ